jgi:hypothetical protein
MYRSSEQKSKALKAEIRSLISQGLADATGSNTVQMQYEHYETQIVHKHGIELVGWTAEKFVQPGNLSSLIEGLQELRDALQNGSCRWRKLTSLEKKARIDEYHARVKSGEIQPKKRKV